MVLGIESRSICNFIHYSGIRTKLSCRHHPQPSPAVLASAKSLSQPLVDHQAQYNSAAHNAAADAKHRDRSRIEYIFDGLHEFLFCNLYS